LNREKLKELLADYYRKRDAISKEIDIISSDFKERRSKRYTRLIYTQDLLTKRIIDLEARLGDEGDVEETQVEKMRTLFELVEHAHKYKEQYNKKPLMTLKVFPTKDSTSIFPSHSQRKVPLSFEQAEEELEQLLLKNRRLLLGKTEPLKVNKSKNATHNQKRRK
jgi:hypothetical protein